MPQTRPRRLRLSWFPVATLAAAVAAGALPAEAQKAAKDPVKVIGTFTVNGKTTTWKHIYVSRHEDEARPSQHFLIVLAADRPVAEADRAPQRLQELAVAGQVRAVRMVWHEGFDGIATTPFHKDASDSGQVTRGGAIIDLTRYDEQQLEAQFKSKMLGQNWHFNAFFKGTITQGPPMDAPDMDAPLPTTYVPKGHDPSAIKREVGSRGFEWTSEGFFQAVTKPDLEAVQLFLKGGMAANTKNDQGMAMLMYASMYCERSEAYPAVVDALLAGGADPNIKDDNGSTPLIWASQNCGPAVVQSLVKAGADVNAKAKGGATALMMAEVMNRAENAAILKKAGAKPWK